jgi:phospholipase C
MIRPGRVAYVLYILIVSLMPSSHSVRARTLNEEHEPKTPIKHFIVLMQENHTFDNYFGTYPGAAGIPVGTCMPAVLSGAKNADCVEPFHIGSYPTEDLDQSKRTFNVQYNQGHMNGFIYALNQRNQDGNLAMGYYDGRDLPYYWNLADEFVLFDRFFSSASGGSTMNHMYWVAGVPGSEKGIVPPRGYGNLPTIFDRLTEHGISWKFYVENYDPTITYRSLPSEDTSNRTSQVIRVPLLNFERFVDDPQLFSQIVDLNEYFQDLENGTLPAVAYIVSSDATEHPPRSIRAGQRLLKKLIQALMQSDAWSSSIFMWTYDNWGGWYDHVPPPQVDKYGYGFRVPALLVSPYARRGYIDSTELDFTSILRFIEDNWDLEPLAQRDARANSIATALDFSQSPRQPFFISFSRAEAYTPFREPRRQVIYAAYGAAVVFVGLMFTIVNLISGSDQNRRVAGAKSRRKRKAA